MVRIALVGAGSHSRAHHAPAMARYAALYPDQLELAAVCDLERSKGEAFARDHGFKTAYTDYAEMLETEELDGCICVMPHHLIAAMAMDLMRRGIPAMVEKPLGASLEQASDLLAVAQETGTANMVSMNRRFEPLMMQGVSWTREQGEARYVRASILRHDRRQANFMSGAAVHCVDMLRAIAGEIADVQLQTQEVTPYWSHFTFVFESGAIGSLDALPTCGSVEERYEVFGEGYRMDACVGPSPRPRLRCWSEGELALDQVPPDDQPDFVRVGAYGEIREFVAALIEGREPQPSVAEVLPSVEIAYSFDPSRC